MSRQFGITAAIGAIVVLGVSGGALLSSNVNLHVPASRDTVRAISPMGQARAAHTATSLPDGNVLVVGGFTQEEGQPAGTEMFDQIHERFEPVAQPLKMRLSHTATLLRDGRVLIAGGLAGTNLYHDTAELFDPATKTFSMTGRMTTERSNHTAVLLDDGRVLLVGGTGTGWTFLASAEIYDPRTGTFAATGVMGEPREGHVAVKLLDGRVLVAGGHRGRRAATVISRTAEIYDVATGRFVPTGAMSIRRHKHDAQPLGNGHVLVLGGADERDNEGVYSSVELFDPGTGTFRSGSPMRIARYKHRGTTVILAGGKLLLAGGAPRAEVYDPATGKSEIVRGAGQLAGQFSAAALLPGGRVLITGGYGQGRGPRAEAWVFEPSAGQGQTPGR